MSYTLGVDIGTFESKGVLVDREGHIVAEARRPHEMIVPQPGWAEHRAEEDWWGDFVFITRKILANSRIDPRAIKAVATSAIGPCMQPVAMTSEPLMNAALYGVDNRAAKEVEELMQLIGEERLLEVCGNALTSQSVGPKILWLKRHHPELFALTRKVLTSTSYLTFRLTGNYVIDHYTAAGFSPLYDVNTLSWTQALCDTIIETYRLPDLRWSNEIAGEVHHHAAEMTGLAVGTPVTTGTIDAAAEALSVGVCAPGDMMLMYGSTIFIIGITETRQRDPRLWYAPWLFEGQHASMAGLATSGTLTHWFRDQCARELSREEAFGVLSKEAEASPKGARNLLFHPYFSGERTPIHDPQAVGSWFGLNLTHDRGDMYRALLEGIAHGTRHAIDTFDAVGQAPRALHAVGGGTRNAVWSQATSDISGHDQIVREKTIGASYGDAFLAACTIGEAKLTDIDQWNPKERVIKAVPDPVYDHHHTLYRKFYTQTRELAHQLSHTP